LCLLQIAFSENECHFVKFDPGYLSKKIKPVNLVSLLSNENIKKVFHYGRFDLAMIKKFLGVEIKNMFCTKIASKLVRTYTDKHGLKELCKEMLNVDLNKSSQSSDWSVRELSKEQLKYASHDVIYLFRLKEKLEEMIAREDRQELLQKSFDFLPIRVKLDLAGWHDTDIFSH
jgi:ribonuclease D